jgi:DNA-binding transcriptional LysR family regulator
MDGLEVRQLRYFVAVAEELSFGRAAERLGIAQPPLSRAIQRLEAELGVALLERTTRRVALTPAGAVLLEQGRSALDAVAAAGRRAQRAGGPSSRVLLAVKPSGDVGPLQELLRAYHGGNPDLPAAEVVVCGYGQPAAMLHDGRADVALLRVPFDGAGLDFEPLVTEPRVAIVAAGHRLVRRGRVCRADLAQEPVPRWPDLDEAAAAYWAGTDLTSPATEGSAAPPAPPGPVVRDLPQMLEVVALGQAVAFLPASAAERCATPEIAQLAVADLSPSTVAVAWPDDCRSLAVAALVRAACELAGHEPAKAARLA